MKKNTTFTLLKPLGKAQGIKRILLHKNDIWDADNVLFLCPYFNKVRKFVLQMVKNNFGGVICL